MRQAMQLTFQGLTKSFKFTPEFSNVLFMITFLQIGVFGHYFSSSQRNHLAKASYEIQEEDLQATQVYETALKEIIPFFHIYFTNSAKQASAETLKLIGRLHSPTEARIIQKEMTGAISLPIKRSFDATLNSPKFIFNLLENKGNILVEAMDSEEFILKILPVFSNNGTPFYPKGGNEMHSIDPDPVNFEPLPASSREEDQEKSAQEESLEKEKSEGALSEASLGTINTTSEKKEIRVETVAGEETHQENRPADSRPSRKELSFKAFYHYNIPSKSRLLNYWMQLTAPSENVSEKEIPYREALKEIMLSGKFHPMMNEANWYADPEDNEDVKLAISQMHEEAFYDYLRSINWEKTEFGTLFECPQIPGKEDFHQAKEDAFNYAYELVGRCAPGLCRDEDFIVRN